MLSHEKVNQLLSRFTYKPNWVIEVLPKNPVLPPGQAVKLYLTQYVENSRSSFQPWDFTIHELFEPELVRVAVRVDRMGYAFSPQRHIFPVGGMVTVPPIAEDREDRFWIWLHDVAIPDLERHEISEWFKVDRKLMFDPHKAGEIR